MGRPVTKKLNIIHKVLKVILLLLVYYILPRFFFFKSELVTIYKIVGTGKNHQSSFKRTLLYALKFVI